MDQVNERDKHTARTRAIWIALGSCPILAVICFIAVATLPATDKAHFQDPLRSLLTGLGVLGIAAPFCVGGYLLDRRAASSPYFEGRFIATAVMLFGAVCLVAGLACLILGIYDLVMLFLAPPARPQLY